jgi:hypothetical protein
MNLTLLGKSDSREGDTTAVIRVSDFDTSDELTFAQRSRRLQALRLCDSGTPKNSSD